MNLLTAFDVSRANGRVVGPERQSESAEKCC